MTVPAFARGLWRLFCVVCVLGGCIAQASSLDREAFSITSYDLALQIDPPQHRLGARGKITLRNDSASPQKIAVLQISSSLDWRSITLASAGEDKALQYLTQTYTSDIDHTGALSEAIVTLPQPVAPHGTVELNVAYEGVVVLDATRLIRIGAPDDVAESSDWDQIDEKFTALRGAGYVAWYPIMTESANLSEENELAEVLARWKARAAGSRMHLKITVDPSGSVADDRMLWTMFFDGVPCAASGSEHSAAECLAQNLRLDVPSLVIADYKVLERPDVEVRFLTGHEAAAARFADDTEKAAPLVAEWFGKQHEKAQVADLPNPNAAPFESGALLMTPLTNSDSKLAGLAAAHQLTHASFLSFRPWIEEGLAHFAQALYLEHEKNRQAALDYMGLHRSAFMQLEKPATVPRSNDEAAHSLINTTDEELYRSKAMCVWWMLRDMVGDAALKKAIAAYRPEEDKEPSYVQRLIAAQTQRDLEWFFDDWVYRDRGLPDFKVESAFPRKTLTNTFIVSVTVDNLGTAGAEVPVIVKTAGADVVRRLEVRAKSKATLRIETPSAPVEVVVNDGSVPESDLTNNVFKVEAAAK
jgi:hypothetical protein